MEERKEFNNAWKFIEDNFDWNKAYEGFRLFDIRVGKSPYDHIPNINEIKDRTRYCFSKVFRGETNKSGFSCIVVNREGEDGIVVRFVLTSMISLI